MNGSRPHEGRVEICFNETWGTVCDQISRYYSWNHSQADIVCKQLGYSQAGKMSEHDSIHTKILICHADFFYSESSTYYFGRGSSPVNITYVYCSGTESSLADCSYSTRQSSVSNCIQNYNIIGVQCRSGIDIIAIL